MTLPGPIVQELHLTIDNPTHRALFQLGKWPCALRSAILHHGPCRQKGPFAISSKNGNRYICWEENYHAHSGAMWKLNGSGSPSHTAMNKSYCQSCCLFGYQSALQKEWANGLSGNPKNFEVKIKSHETTQAHLDASIAFGDG